MRFLFLVIFLTFAFSCLVLVLKSRNEHPVIISQAAADNCLQRTDPDQPDGNHLAAGASRVVGNWKLTCSHCWLACSSCEAVLRHLRCCVPQSLQLCRRRLRGVLCVEDRQRRRSRLVHDWCRVIVRAQGSRVLCALIGILCLCAASGVPFLTFLSVVICGGGRLCVRGVERRRCLLPRRGLFG